MSVSVSICRSVGHSAVLAWTTVFPSLSLSSPPSLLFLPHCSVVCHYLCHLSIYPTCLSICSFSQFALCVPLFSSFPFSCMRVYSSAVTLHSWSKHGNLCSVVSVSVSLCFCLSVCLPVLVMLASWQARCSSVESIDDEFISTGSYAGWLAGHSPHYWALPSTSSSSGAASSSTTSTSSSAQPQK